MYLMKDIVREGDSRLKTKCTKVSVPLTSADYNCIKQLYEYMVVSGNEDLCKQYHIRPGVGIAAPQVGVTKRMFAMSCNDFLDEKNTNYSFAFINPEITYRSPEMVYLPGGEGCLSVDRNTDGMMTPRHYLIKIKGTIIDFTTNKLKNISMTLTGYPAIVFQHEYDHLDGILYTDKMFKEKDIQAEPLYTCEEDEDEEQNEEK